MQNNILLGLIVDTVNLKFRIYSKKIEEIKDLINQALAKNKNHIRKVSKMVSKLISFYRSTRPIARVMTRATYRIIAKAANWNLR